MSAKRKARESLHEVVLPLLILIRAAHAAEPLAKLFEFFFVQLGASISHIHGEEIYRDWAFSSLYSASTKTLMNAGSPPTRSSKSAVSFASCT